MHTRGCITHFVYFRSVCASVDLSTEREQGTFRSIAQRKCDNVSKKHP